MFEPPRCAHADCPNHIDPGPNFYRRHGFYQAGCRPHPIPRFKCRACGRTFSRQTFRADRGDRKPHLNRAVLHLLCSGVGYRQSARVTGLRRKNLEAKARKLCRHLGLLEDNQLARLAIEDADGALGNLLELQMDEFESYETRRNTRPISIPVVIEQHSRFRFAAIASTIRPRGKMTERRLEAVAADEARLGPREDTSRDACLRALGAASQARPGARSVSILTDQKSTYPVLIKQAFFGRQIEHSRIPSVAPRGHGTPLGPINLTEAILRDHVGRLRRESWLVSKRHEFLNLHLRMVNAFRNWVRPRFNRDVRTPAEIAGYAPRALKLGDFVGWRQDWRGRSPCPFRGPRWSAMESMAA